MSLIYWHYFFLNRDIRDITLKHELLPFVPGLVNNLEFLNAAFASNSEIFEFEFEYISFSIF